MKSGAIITLFFMTAFISSTANSANNPAPSPHWKQLAAIPDPVGWAGMFGGVLGGKVIVGGGSHFPEKPIWLQGTKAFNDRLYVLSEPGGPWVVLDARAPEKSGNAAFAATPGAIYLVGGIAADGYRNTCYVLQLQGTEVVSQPLPAFPQPLGYGVAAVVGGRLVVTGGQHSATEKAASAETWSLELGRPDAAWVREPDLPGPGVIVPGTAIDGTGFFVFGGMSFSGDGKPVPAKGVYRFDGVRRTWERLADMPEARVAPAAPAALLADGSFLIVGGYAEVFAGVLREHPGFSAQTLIYDAKQRAWRNGPVLPRAPIGNRDATTDAGPTPMVAAPCVVWRDLAIVASGEIRGATRTTAVVAWPIR